MIHALFAGKRLLLTLAVIAGATGMCGLGIWQLNRLDERLALNERITSRMALPPLELTSTDVDLQALDYRRVELRGTYDYANEIVLRGRAYNGRPGVHVVTPLRLSNSDAAVLVDRGWLPLESSRPEERRAFVESSGEVTLEGVARRPPDTSRGPQDPPLEPGQARRDAWFRVDIGRIQQQVDYRLLPLYVELQPAPGAPDLPLRVATTDLGPGSHMSYAIQWFSFALILLGGYGSLIYQQVRREAQPAASPQVAHERGGRAP